MNLNFLNVMTTLEFELFFNVINTLEFELKKEIMTTLELFFLAYECC